MAKTKISEFDVDPANNTDINNINIAEGCAPSGINNAIRQLMSDLKEQLTGASGDPFTVGGAFAANGGATLGDASGDALTINSSAVSIPNGLNFDSNTFVIDAANNNVGIGTASPATKLNIYGTSTQELRISTNTAGDTRLGFDIQGAYYNWIDNYRASGAMAFATNNTERMRIDSSGNVGIGTSSPAKLFEARGVDAVARFRGSSTQFLDITATNGGTVNLDANNGTAFAFSTNTTECMRIDNNGNLLVGTTSQLQSGKVCIQADFNNFNGMVMNDTGSGTSIAYNYFSRGGVLKGSISYNSVSNLISYNTTSDYRLKENIVTLSNALQTVSQLKPRQYDWKETGATTTGFIAHELAEVLPHAVSGEKDAVDAEGNPKYQGIDTSFLVATLTAAIQELKAIVDAQAERIAVLENK